jgi:hypothetical protein
MINIAMRMMQFATATGGVIEFIGATSSENSTSITLPSGLAQNDIVIVASMFDVYTGVYTASAPNLPTGYTAGSDSITEGWSWSFFTTWRWSYKKMGVTPDTTASGLTAQADGAHIALAFRGVDGTTPLDVSPPTSSNGSSGMPVCPAITMANTGISVIIGFLDDDLASDTVAPGGYSLAINKTFGVAETGGTIMAAYKQVGAGTETPTIFGGTGSDSWSGVTIGLRLN